MPRSSRPSTSTSTPSPSACASRPTSTGASTSASLDERVEPAREKNFYFEGGIVSFVRHINKNKDVLTRPIDIDRREGTTSIEVAIQYNDSFSETVLAFANNIHTVDGGTHVTGFRAGLTTSLNDWARRQGIIKDSKDNLSGEDVREGLTAVISVKLTEPQFEGQTKAKLGNADVKGAVQAAVSEGPQPVPRREPRRRAQDRGEVPDRAARPGGGPQGARPGHPQVRARGQRPAGQARRLPGTRPGAVRAVHRRGRLRRRLRQAGPRPPLPGDPAHVRQDAQRREGAPGQDAVLGEDPAADHRPGHGHRRHVRHQPAALPQGHPAGGRGRRRRPHPDAADDLLLPQHAGAHRERLPLRRPAAAVPGEHRQGDPLRLGRTRARPASPRT